MRAKEVKARIKISDNMGALSPFEMYPDDFKTFLAHIQKEYDIDHSFNEWSLIKVLQNGFGMHHGKLPKYIQQEILEQFNKGTFDILFCTSTIPQLGSGISTIERPGVQIGSDYKWCRGVYLSGDCQLCEPHRLPPHECHLEAGSSNSRKVLEENKQIGGRVKFKGDVYWTNKMI